MPSPIYLKNTRAWLLVATLISLTGCTKTSPTGWQGYIEGEFIYVAAPLAGQLEKLSVTRGQHVAAGAPLFTLEQSAELATLRQAAEQLRQTQARLADLKKGQRPSELAALEARLAQTKAAAELSAIDFARVAKLHETTVISDDDFDRARLTHAANTELVAQAEAQLATAKLGARSDTLAAAEAETSAAQAVLDRAGWSVAQKSQSAAQAGLIFDTLYRQGEFVAAGAPVVSLLPPENLKVRFFVPEGKLAALKTGAAVRVAITGRTEPLTAHISYLSPQPEYTPPVLYNRENRSKLVFMVEALFEKESARDLHPGQPVDVTTPTATP